MTNPPVMGTYPSTVRIGARVAPPPGRVLNNITIGSGILSIAIFFLIAFASNAIFSSITLATLGITITLSVLTFMGIIILILFVL